VPKAPPFGGKTPVSPPDPLVYLGEIMVYLGEINVYFDEINDNLTDSRVYSARFWFISVR
jgi:hypothetical protein